jgi:hypothetical protein
MDRAKKSSLIRFRRALFASSITLIHIHSHWIHQQVWVDVCVAMCAHNVSNFQNFPTVFPPFLSHTHFSLRISKQRQWNSTDKNMYSEKNRDIAWMIESNFGWYSNSFATIFSIFQQLFVTKIKILS